MVQRYSQGFPVSRRAAGMETACGTRDPKGGAPASEPTRLRTNMSARVGNKTAIDTAAARCRGAAHGRGPMTQLKGNPEGAGVRRLRETLKSQHGRPNDL